MFPLKDDLPSHTTPVVTVLLIAINIVVYLYQTSLEIDGRTGGAAEAFVMEFGLIPCRLTGYCREEVLGRELRQLIVPEQVDLVAQLLRGDGGPSLVALTCRTRDGQHQRLAAGGRGAGADAVAHAHRLDAVQLQLGDVGGREAEVAHHDLPGLGGVGGADPDGAAAPSPSGFGRPEAASCTTNPRASAVGRTS